MTADSLYPFVCLQVTFPRSMENELLDACSAIPDVPDFTIIATDGFGNGTPLHSVREMVLGRAQRRLLVMVARQDVCSAVIAGLRKALPTAEAAYWMVPVSDAGRFA